MVPSGPGIPGAPACIMADATSVNSACISGAGSRRNTANASGVNPSICCITCWATGGGNDARIACR